MFTLDAAFAWGVGFYGPSVFLQTLHVTHGWPVAIISLAVTVHFLLSALIITYLPEIHQSWGIALTTTVGALLSAGGLLTWSGAWERWQIFGAAGLSGARSGQYIMMDRRRMPLDVRFANPTSWRGAVGRQPKLLSSTRPGRRFNNG